MIDNWIIYIIVTYIAGVLTGALGEYFSNVLTDLRHNREANVEEKKLFQNVTSQMPDLISEMKNDLSKPEDKLIREFFVSKRTWTITLPEGEHFFFYFEEDHIGLRDKINVLENLGYIIKVKSGTAPIYRITEKFVRLVSNHG